MNLPLRPLFASMLAPLLVVGVCACSTAAAGNAPGSSPTARESKSPSSDPGALRAFAKEIGVNCETAAGRLACIGGRPEVGDYSDVELHPDCGKNGWFGVITSHHSVELRDRISPLDTRTIAAIEPKQAVCIRAIGQVKGKPFYYFVTAIPSAAAPGCIANRACTSSTGPVIRWTSKTPVPSCITDTQRALRDCASGWIQAEELSRLATRSQAH